MRKREFPNYTEYRFCTIALKNFNNTPICPTLSIMLQIIDTFSDNVIDLTPTEVKELYKALGEILNAED